MGRTIYTVTAMFKGRNVPAAGAIATAVLVLLFGNPPFVEWIRNPANVNPNGFIGFLLNQLTWPEWQFAPKDDSSGATRDMLANDLRALLIDQENGGDPDLLVVAKIRRNGVILQTKRPHGRRLPQRGCQHFLFDYIGHTGHARPR